MERVGNLQRRSAMTAAAIVTGAVGVVLVLLPDGARSASSAQAADVTGTIQIIKNTAFGDATFGYTTTTSQGGSGLPADFSLTTVNGTASVSFDVVGSDTEVETYTVTESSVPDDWEFDDLVCTDSENTDGGTTVDIDTMTATIAMNAADQVVCTFTNEHVRVPPEITTEIHDDDHEEITSAPIGSTVHDEAEVSGPNGTPSGVVDFRVWLGNTTCSGDSVSAGEDIGLEDGVAHPSDPIVVPPGGLSFRAQYEGDSTYDDGESECEPLEAEKLEPDVETEIHDEDHEEITSAPIGSTVHDEAEVSGSLGTPTGEVEFRVWLGNTTCTGDSVSAGEVELEDGEAHPSDPVVVPAGGLSFRAEYDGDSTYEDEESDCEPLAAVGGTIVVEKQTSENGAAGTFAFSGDAAGSIGDNGQIVVSGLAPGTYTSTEATATGWILTSISCDDQNSTGSVATRAATFRVEAGETVKCTFTNAQQPITLGHGSIDVQKSASPTSVKEPGGPVTFSVSITNTSNVVVTIQNIVDDRFGDLDDEGGNDCFDAPINLGPGQSVNCTFQRSITGAGGTAHTNTVTATGQDALGNPVSDSDDARVDITPRSIDLAIVKEASSPTPLNGVVTYSLTVTNKGPDPATNVQVADPAPAGIVYLTASPSQGTCNRTDALVTCSLGTIGPGQTVRIAVTGRARTVGSHTNTATVTGSGGREANPADNVDSATTVVPAPLRPPSQEPQPEPEPCLSLAVSPRMIRADAKPDRVTVRVTAGKRRMKGVRVVVRGSGVRKAATSDSRGLAVLRINPKRAGIITITARDPSRDVCGPKRIGVVGVFLPPVTG